MDISRSEVEQILGSYDSSLVLERYERLTGGNLNAPFEITTTTGQIILRLTPDAYAYRIGKERVVFDLIRTHTAIPVPHILAVDSSKRIVPYAYVLMEKLPGMMLRFTPLTSEELRHLYTVLGSTLATLHMIRLPAFGWILESGISRRIDREVEPYGSWREAFFDQYHTIIADLSRFENARFGSIDKQFFTELVPRIDALLDRHADRFPIDVEPVLLHGDYTLRNVLIEKDPWRATGVLDVEFARAGHSEFELASLDHFLCDPENILAYSEHARFFLEGYAMVKPLSEGFEERRLLYLLVSLFSLAVYETFKEKINDEEEVRFLYRSIVQILEHYEC